MYHCVSLYNTAHHDEPIQYQDMLGSTVQCCRALPLMMQHVVFQLTKTLLVGLSTGLWHINSLIPSWCLWLLLWHFQSCILSSIWALDPRADSHHPPTLPVPSPLQNNVYNNFRNQQNSVSHPQQKDNFQKNKCLQTSKQQYKQDSTLQMIIKPA